MRFKPNKLTKIIAVLVLVLACVVAGAYIYASNMVKPEIYQQQIVDEIKKQTGLDAKIEGKARLALFPMPKLVISDMTMGIEADNAPATPKFSVKKIEIHISPFSIFSKNIQFSGITLSRPSLLLEMAQDETMHWQWLNANLLKSLDSNNWQSSLPLTINDGTVTYQDSFNSKGFALESIDISGFFGTKLQLQGSAKISDQKFSITIDNKTSDLKAAAGESPLNFSIVANNKNHLKIQSLISTDAATNSAKLAGNFESITDDLEQWLPTPPQNNKPSSGKNSNSKKDEKLASQTEKKIPLPMAISGELLFENNVIHTKNLVLDGLNSKGQGSADIYWKHWYPTISANLDFASLDYNMWKQLLKNRIGTTNNAAKPNADEVRNYDFRRENPIPQNIELNIKATAQKVIDGKQEWGKSRLDAVLEDGALTLNQCDIELGGGGIMSLFGVMSQGGNGELRFQGNIEAKGHSLKQTIAMFNAAAGDLPSIGLGEFSASANLYIAPNQINFSEGKAILENANITGEIISYLGTEPHTEAKLRIKEVNFDFVRDSLRKQKAASENTPLNAVDYGLSFEWLKKLQTKLEAKIFVDSFTFMERKGDKASLSLYAYDGVFKLLDAQLKYPDYLTSLNFNLSMKGIQPALTLTMNTDQLDTSYFSLDDKKPSDTTPSASFGQNSSLPFDWMDNFNGVFDISIRKLIHKEITLEKLKLQARLDGKQLNIQNLRFVYSQAQTEIGGVLYGGKIPGINIRFTLMNADLYDLVKSLTGLTNISGYANLSGAISTSGHNLKEWLQQMDAKLLLAARTVKIDNLNIAGISNIVSVSRTSADVVNNVNNILTKGTTDFTVDGSLNIAEGEIRIPSIALKSGQVTGNLVGGINLSTMMVQLSTLLGFSNLSPTTPPTIIIQLSGALNAPEIKVDTSTLEAFVAKRSVKEK